MLNPSTLSVRPINVIYKSNLLSMYLLPIIFSSPTKHSLTFHPLTLFTPLTFHP